MSVAFFPGKIWDGSSGSRPNPNHDGETALETYRGPDAVDWQQLQAELQSIEIQLGAGGISGTTATKGYFFLPTVAGSPTGIPANVPAGFVAACYDSTDSKIAIFNGTSWVKTAALS